MKKLLLLLFFPLFLNPLASQQSLKSALKNLIDKEWIAEGEWGNKSKFKQEQQLSFHMDSSFVLVMSKGFTNQDGTDYGLRNIGVRRLINGDSPSKFIEFDVFGGQTEGIIYNEGPDIYYQYAYGADTITDMWKYIDDNTYQYVVGAYIDGEWKAKYLDCQFIATAKSQTLYMLKTHLIGQWESTLDDGTLKEAWFIKDNVLRQEAAYFLTETNEKIYEASNELRWLDEELILTTIIKDQGVKIFKATDIGTQKVTFENDDYGFPNKVVYDFSDSKFIRTVSGIQDGQQTQVVYRFEPITSLE